MWVTTISVIGSKRRRFRVIMRRSIIARLARPVVGRLALIQYPRIGFAEGSCVRASIGAWRRAFIG
jgi:hypothetical protein